MRREGYDTEVKPGVSTFRTDKSREGLPTDVDREKQVNLPPGSATPNDARDEETDQSKGRNLKSPSFNGPSSGSGVPARSLPTPGEEYGHPVKEDYGTVRRRSMEATDVLAYAPRVPWRVQHRQDTWTRLKDKKYYRQNKSEITQRMKRWYRSVKRDRRFQNNKEKRRENPNRYERKKVADAALVAEAFLDRVGYTPKGLGFHPHRQHGAPKTRRRRDYQHNRSKSRRQHHVWYQRNKHKPGFQRRQRMRRQHPTQFHMRRGGFVPAEPIWFAYGAGMTVAAVDSVFDGGVAFTPVEAPDTSLSMSVRAFLRAVVFLTPEDADAFYAVLDEGWGGEDAYDDPTQDDLDEVASAYGAELLADPVDDIDGVASALVADAADAAFAEDVRQAGDVILYDQRPPGDWEKPDTSKRTWESGAPGQWTNTSPKPTHDPTPNSSDVEPNESYFQGGSGKVMPDEMRTAATMEDILSGTAADVRARAREVPVSLRRADPRKGIWTFTASGSEGKRYVVRIKGLRSGNLKELRKMDVEVSCSCPFYRWQGPEHWGVTEDYMYGRPQGTASFPRIRDPQRQHLACKHALACIEVAQAYRVASTADPAAVAARYGLPVEV